MKKLIFLSLLTLCTQAREIPFKKMQNFLIKPVCSNVDYPTKGDEHISVAYKNLIYMVDILHPNLSNDMQHFSVPIFRVAPINDKNRLTPNGIQTLPVDVSALTWNSACGYFFVQTNGRLRGYFLEDGMDNQDGCVDGLILTYDGKKTNSYAWSHGCSIKDNVFNITNLNTMKTSKTIPSTLKPVLEYAKQQANGWPGP